MKQSVTLEDSGGISAASPVTTSSSSKRPLTLSLTDQDSHYSPILVSPLTSSSSSWIPSSSLTQPEPSTHSPSMYSSSPYFYSLRRQPAAKTKSSNDPSLLTHSSSLTSLERRKPKGILRRRRSSGSGTSGSIKEKRRGIKFAPEAILLNAAWEGDLDLLKKCIKEVS